MLDNLTNRFSNVLENIRGQAKLTEDGTKGVLREVRLALLEASVVLSVVREFVNNVKEKALGQEVADNLTPSQAFIGVINQVLIELMGKENKTLDLSVAPPAVVLMVGLQGAGKTATVDKLARLLKNEQEKKVLVVPADVYRPAAIEQLRLLTEQVGIDFFPSNSNQEPIEIATAAINYTKKRFYDVLMVNTAGCLAIDEEMTNEIKALHAAANPVETLFVIDAILNRDAVNTAQAFNEALPLTGITLTKTDDDPRDGAALSMHQITDGPVKFIDVGGKITGLEPFHPDRITSCILGMGDVLNLIEDAQKGIDEEAAAKMAKKLQKGKGFDLNDFKEQIQQVHNMDGLESLMSKMSGKLGQISKQIPEGMAGRAMGKVEAIINSMTPKEYANPALLKASRKRRIAAGAGTNVQEVSKLLKQFEQSQQMMRMFSDNGMMKLVRMVEGIRDTRGMFPNS